MQQCVLLLYSGMQRDATVCTFIVFRYAKRCNSVYFYCIPVCKEMQQCARARFTWINAWQLKFVIPSACPSHRCVLMLPVQDWRDDMNSLVTYLRVLSWNSGIWNTINSWLMIVHLLKNLEQRSLVRISSRPPVTRTNVLSWFCSDPRMDVVVEFFPVLPPFCRYLC